MARSIKRNLATGRPAGPGLQFARPTVTEAPLSTETSRLTGSPPGAWQVRRQVSPGTCGRDDGLTRHENLPEAGTTISLESISGIVGVGEMHWSVSVNP